MTKNRGQASLGKTVEPNGDSEIEIDDQEVDMKSDTSIKDVSDNSKRKRDIEAVGKRKKKIMRQGLKQKETRKDPIRGKGWTTMIATGKRNQNRTNQ